MANIMPLASPLSVPIFQLLIAAATSSLTFLVGRIIFDSYLANRAYNNFKRLTRGLIMAKGRNIICNHSLNLLRRNSLKMCLIFGRHGQKTVGWLHHEKFCASTIDPELMKQIVLDQPNKNINRTKIGGPAIELMEETLMLAENEQWRRLRRAVAPALRATKFKAPNVVHEIESSIEKLVAAIERKLSASHQDPKLQTTTIKADDLLHRFTLDVVFRCFYKQYDLIDFNAPQCRWTELVERGLEGFRSLVFQAGFMLKSLCKPINWLVMHLSAEGRWHCQLIDFIHSQTELSLRARKELEEARAKGFQLDEDHFQMKDGSRFRRNMADHITDHLLDGKISRREYFNTSIFLITAADKTIFDSLVHTLYQLAIDVDGVQKKLRESIKVEGVDSVYLDWVLSESLRLMPPAPVTCSRTIVEDIQINKDGTLLPAGTYVDYSGYLVHRLKEYWGEDAEEFKPERWRDTSHHHPLQYVPFGAGVRQCPGREFALFEMKKLLAKLMLRYKFNCEPTPDVHEFYAPFTAYLVHDSPTFIKISRI